jgi:hypothetical protein
VPDKRLRGAHTVPNPVGNSGFWRLVIFCGFDSERPPFAGRFGLGCLLRAPMVFAFRVFDFAPPRCILLRSMSGFEVPV